MVKLPEAHYLRAIDSSEMSEWRARIIKVITFSYVEQLKVMYCGVRQVDC